MHVLSILPLAHCSLIFTCQILISSGKPPNSPLAYNGSDSQSSAFPFPHGTYLYCAQSHDHLSISAPPPRTGMRAPQSRDRVCPGPHCVPSHTQHRARPRAFINAREGWQTEPQLLSSKFCQVKVKQKILRSFISQIGHPCCISTAWVTRKAAVTKTELSSLGELTGLGMEGGQALK